MNIHLRQTEPADHPATEHLTREAFYNHYVPGPCCEHYLLHLLRESPILVPALDLVAEADGQIVGNILLVKGLLRRDDGLEQQVLTLGPIAVLPRFQGQGVGSALIRRAKAVAAELGHPAILLTGDPAYYSCLGFVPAEDCGIRTADGLYMDALQVCELIPGALGPGSYHEDTAYQVDLALAAEFDRAFPPKETVEDTPTQRRFLELVKRVRRA